MHKHLAWVFILVACVLPARATTLYTTFGPSQAFGSGGYTVEDNLGWASPFQTTATGAVGSVDLALALQGGSMSIKVVIASDSSGSPGAALDTYTITNLPATATVESAVSTLNPVLSAGTPYWFEVIGQGSNPGTDIGQWYNNTLGLTQTIDISNTGGSTWSVFSAGESDPAFDVVSTVPEPGLFSFAAISVVAFTFRRRT